MAGLLHGGGCRGQWMHSKATGWQHRAMLLHLPCYNGLGGQEWPAGVRDGAVSPAACTVTSWTEDRELAYFSFSVAKNN